MNQKIQQRRLRKKEKRKAVWNDKCQKARLFHHDEGRMHIHWLNRNMFTGYFFWIIKDTGFLCFFQKIKTFQEYSSIREREVFRERFLFSENWNRISGPKHRQEFLLWRVYHREVREEQGWASPAVDSTVLSRSLSMYLSNRCPKKFKQYHPWVARTQY